MYLPAAFVENDPAKLLAAIERYSFGILVSVQNGEPFATHLPFLADREPGPRGCLLGHVARANPQWEDLDGQPVLAIFSGPHAYISPAWYEAERVVPTWNYVAIHVYGTLRVVEDQQALTGIVQRTVTTYESPRAAPWTFDSDSEFARNLLQAIVGFRIEITRLEGKWKLSQNHPPERREKVIQALHATNGDELAIAELMAEKLSDAT